jgi:hypothetical protein
VAHLSLRRAELVQRQACERARAVSGCGGEDQGGALDHVAVSIRAVLKVPAPGHKHIGIGIGIAERR